MDELDAPKDHYRLAYIIFYLLGCGSLLPWNFFITGTYVYDFEMGNTALRITQFESQKILNKTL